eukprot:TRINITY_DN2161_c0_g1_i1.p1 TRINITY_DN2161_c0_g1~~TRINITY_DN2161_c0_g1_i1.p1  ORF type:complete len:134 (-),score=22.08 TRINITY_DN2161_c0_g1_i1:33-434(-)
MSQGDYSDRVQGSGKWKTPVAVEPEIETRGSEHYAAEGSYTGATTLAEPLTVAGPDPLQRYPVHSNQDDVQIGDKTGAIGQGAMSVSDTAKSWAGEGKHKTKGLKENVQVDGGWKESSDIAYRGLEPGSAIPK